MLNFDMASLSTKVPLKDKLQLLEHFEVKISDLFWEALTSTYILSNRKFYDQTDGITMGYLPCSNCGKLLHGKL